MKSLNGVLVKSIIREGKFRVLTITFTSEQNSKSIDYKLYSKD